MHAQFKLDKHAKKCPVKPKSLLPIHDIRMRVCARWSKWLKQGEKKNWDRKINSGIVIEMLGRFAQKIKLEKKNSHIHFKLGFGSLFLST